ncbi:hypothetical protein Tco_0211071 [Tanacetum coccineum]
MTTEGSFFGESVNNETPIIDAEPISVVLPANVADNIVDSSNTSSDDELPSSASPHIFSPWRLVRRQKGSAGKGTCSMPSRGSPHRRAEGARCSEASKVDVGLGSSFLHCIKPRANLAIHFERGGQEGIRPMFELEKKCNESLQDLDKSSLVSDMRSKIETLQGQKMPGYRTSSKDEYDRAGEDMANAFYPFLSEFTSNPYALWSSYCQ